MRPYIFTERNGIHILDLQQTIRALNQAYDMVRDIVAEGGTVVFVGTKRQAQENIMSQAMRCGMPFVTTRWLGGTLTNFRTIRSRIEYMLDLEDQRSDGMFERLPKKEAMDKIRELAKLQRRLGGLRNLHRLPDALFVADVNTEDIAVAEANRLSIPVIAMVDTNCDPNPIDVVIPANDDAIRAILLIASKIADAVVEGQQMRGVVMEEEGIEEEVPAGGVYAGYDDEDEADSETESDDEEDLVFSEDSEDEE